MNSTTAKGPILAFPVETGPIAAAADGRHIVEVAQALPAGWNIKRVGDVATIRYGKAKPNTAGSVPVVGSGGVYGFVSEPLVPFPTLVIGRKGTAGMVWMQSVPSWPSDTTFYLEWTDQTVDPRFLYHCFRNRPISGEHAKTTLPSLQKVDLENYQFPAPPEAEQRAIAEVLLEVRQLIEASDRVIAATRQLKLSLLQHLFTYGPVSFDQADPVRLKDTEVGSIPESWSTATLKTVVDIGYGIQAAVAHLEDSSRGTPILTNVNITTEGVIDLGTLRYYEVPQAKRDRFILRKGDVLFNWRSGSQAHVGKTALFMLDGEYTHSSFILRMRCSDKIRPSFLANYLHWIRSRGFFARRRQQSSVNSVFNKSLSGEIPVLLPPLEIQDQIAEQMSAVESKQAAEEVRWKALQELFRSMLHDLMTGAVRLPEFVTGP